MFEDKVLLITGGTGSFGNTVLERFLLNSFREIRVFSRDEKKQDDMRHHLGSDKVRFYLGDVRDRASVDLAMAGVDYVFHAAALKQVPSCEFFPLQAVMTNVLGANNVIESAIAHGVTRVVALSTDKACYPISAMGMSKALMEKAAVARARGLGPDSPTKICCTRFGNVMSTRGSVIPLFIEKIRRGDPLTVTDPEMTRFLMTLDEAADLVMYAFSHGENGDLFVQKAPACTIGTLAEALKRLYKSDVPVKIIGTRHGEKLYDTLVTREEMVSAEDLGRYYRIPCDRRNLNYEKYQDEGFHRITEARDYHSHNAERMDVEATMAMLRRSPYVAADLADWEWKGA